MEKSYDFNKHKLSAYMDIKKIAENRPPYIGTGFSKLDKLLGGGLSPNLYVLGAVSSLGKSTFLLQAAENIAASRTPVLYFSLEMPVEYISVISLSRQCFKQANDKKSAPKISDLLSGGRKSKNCEDAIGECRERTKELYIIERKDVMSEDENAPFGVDTICEYTKQFIGHQRKKKPPVVIVDYLQLLQSNDSTVNYSERRTVDHNITALWNLAHTFNIPVVVISSVSRVNYEKAIGLASFKESGGIEFSADVVLGLQFSNAGEKDFDLTQAKRKSPRDLKLVVLKNRYGESGVDIGFSYFPAYGYFEETEVGNNDGEPMPQAQKKNKQDVSVDVSPLDAIFGQF